MVQPTLYDGDEILKTHHVPVSVTSSEEDLEIAEITRQKMNEKMNDPVCVEKKIKIIPPNYSKENFLATFTPQTQLTPEQVFWSKDLLKQRAEDLKTNALPVPILPPATLYPPNTPVHLVPRTLPTTSQVNISLGFEQTKRCYLTKVIPFFNLLKEHFDEVQRSLVKEVRAMKAVFENIKVEVDQNVIDKKCGEIERKNLLITNENLIANCIAQDVFYTVTDSALTASRFHDLSNAYNVAMTRVVELEAENSKLLKKIQNDDHDTMIKDFSKLEIVHLNLQLKHQHLKENIENFKSKSSKDVPEFDAFFELGKRDDQIQGHKNTIRVSNATKARRSQSKSNKMNDKTLPANSVPEKKVEDHHRKNKSKLSKKNRVDSSTSVRRTVFNTNSNSLYKTWKDSHVTRIATSIILASATFMLIVASICTFAMFRKKRMLKKTLEECLQTNTYDISIVEPLEYNFGAVSVATNNFSEDNKIGQGGFGSVYQMTSDSVKRLSRGLWTSGYMAPEYVMHGEFSVKLDVFSFGVLVLEIITGQANQSSRDGNSHVYLLSHFPSEPAFFTQVVCHVFPPIDEHDVLEGCNKVSESSQASGNDATILIITPR
ncbi:retrovirus-related pol polyprotein from transposon TNT 1-94 [Tanacetum coccineum]|uniref:Retrovirus-related pol polyprotein from transposon TNT 1-94 n=1 Tax=Tanacetum coccineum TaxID=301880 RepID=A0ABQ5GJI5_9ASTR